MQRARAPRTRAPARTARTGAARPRWRRSLPRSSSPPDAAAGPSIRGRSRHANCAEAQTFPYYRVYWVGPNFRSEHLSAADGLRGYIERIGDSVYYGDCVKSKGIFGGGSCVLPLQVTTVIYRLHSNAPLGPQRNTVVRGVPATIYDNGHSIEIYTGRVAIDVFSDSLSHALAAASQLEPINAPGSAAGAAAASRLLPRALRAGARSSSRR